MADCVDRYSNTLLVSLNNRISFRDASSAAGGAIVSDLRAAPPPIAGDSPEAAMDTFVVEPKKFQNNFIVDESESHDPSCYGIDFLMTGKSVSAAIDIA